MRYLLEVGTTLVALAGVAVLWWPLRGTWSRTELNVWWVTGTLSLITAAFMAVLGIFDHWGWFVPCFILLFCVFLANEGIQSAKAQRRWVVDPSCVVRDESLR